MPADPVPAPRVPDAKDHLAALVACHSCGGSRRDDGGKVLAYHHRHDCAEVLRREALFAGFTTKKEYCP